MKIQPDGSVIMEQGDTIQTPFGCASLDAHPMLIRSNSYNPVIDVLISVGLALLACRLFNTNTLPIIVIMLSRDCKV